MIDYLTPSQVKETAAIRDEAGKVIVLLGGDSAEREVSLRSGAAVVRALQNVGIDATGFDWSVGRLLPLLALQPSRVFIALHGRGGEDGEIQGALDASGIPYTGSRVLGCALAMDKIRAKQLWLSLGLPTPAFTTLAPPVDAARVTANLGLPLMVKPAREGSSVGISLVETTAALAPAVDVARKFDSAVLAEAYVHGAEYTLPLVDGVALPSIRLETPRKFYDYEAKYHADSTRYYCPSGLSSAQEHAIQEIGLKAFDALGASGWGRVDFMVDTQGRPWLIELNIVPGMTDHSLVPMAARAAGWSFEYLVLRILKSSWKRAQ